MERRTRQPGGAIVSRLACWVLCVAILTINWALEGFGNPRMYLVMVVMTGGPLLLHFASQRP